MILKTRTYDFETSLALLPLLRYFYLVKEMFIEQNVGDDCFSKMNFKINI